MAGLTSLEVYSTAYNITPENNKPKTLPTDEQLKKLGHSIGNEY